MKPNYERPEIRKVWADNRPVPTWMMVIWFGILGAAAGFILGMSI